MVIVKHFSIFSFNMMVIVNCFAFIIIVLGTLLAAQDISKKGELFCIDLH